MLGVPKDVLIVVLAVLEVATLTTLVVTVRRTRERDEEIRGLRAELASVPVRAQNAAGWAVRQVVDTATRVTSSARTAVAADAGSALVLVMVTLTPASIL